MTRLFIALLFAVGEARALAESGVSGATGFSLGPDGVSLSAPGFEQGLKIRNDGNGVLSTSFSITGTAARAAGEPSGPVRILPPIQAPATNVLTDSDTFFRNIGRDSAKDARGGSRRPRAQ